MGFNPFKAAKKVVNKVAKPFRKVSQKLIPKEMRFALPYLAAATPFMLPAGGFGASGLFSSAAGRGFLSGLANVAGQAGADPEGEDINLLSTLLAGGTGALSTPEMGDTIRSGINAPQKDAVLNQIQGGEIGLSQVPSDFVMPEVGIFQGAENLGREGLAQAADFLGGSRTGLAKLGADQETLFTKAGAKALGKGVAVPLSQGTGDVAKASADRMMRDYLATDAEEQRQMEETTTADESERANLQMTFMRQAGHDEETIEETLVQNDLGAYYEPPVETAAYGGLMGNDKTYHQYHDQYIPMDSEGIMSYNRGGNVLPKGTEMDYRGGGFIPMGSKERADDVPARLSKNEFVMTADAVRAAGGGSVNEGAKRMYEIMNKLEART